LDPQLSAVVDSGSIELYANSIDPDGEISELLTQVLNGRKAICSYWDGGRSANYGMGFKQNLFPTRMTMQ
jgi:hypothetical protein